MGPASELCSPESKALDDLQRLRETRPGSRPYGCYTHSTAFYLHMLKPGTPTRPNLWMRLRSWWSS
jgi:hypothetical protein